ncbi:MAG: aspartate 1-decarboxylase [Candidatus Bathyarchaeia archaeon]
MKRFMLKSKIHRATVTDTNLHYEGSLTLDEDLMIAADLLPFEEVKVYNITNGHRFETYIIKGEKGSGTVCVNGAAAHLVKKGDLVIIASYILVDEKKTRGYEAKVIIVDENNRVVE